jgi:hypothetical protein
MSLHIPKNKLYHESNVLKSHLTANYDFNTFKEINLLTYHHSDKNTNIEMKHFEDERKKGEEIEKLIQESIEMNAQKA